MSLGLRNLSRIISTNRMPTKYSILLNTKVRMDYKKPLYRSVP